MDLIPVTKIELELTEACNLRCKFCYNSCEPAYCGNAYAIIDILERDGVLELVLTGGEPSNHPDFFNILNYACNHIPRVMVQSNGVNFGSIDNFKELVDKPIACVNFSLHGHKNIHEKLTQVSGSFDSTVQAIKWCVDAGIRVASNMVLTAWNCHRNNIEQLMSLHSELGMREMTVTRFIPCGCGQEASELKISHPVFFETLDNLIEMSKKTGVQFLLANATPRCKLEERHESLCNRCSFGVDKFYIDVHGNILVCGMSRVKLGNVFNEGLLSELALSEIRARYVNCTHIPVECRECTYLDMCGGGCRAAAIANENRPDGEDPLVF